MHVIPRISITVISLLTCVLCLVQKTVYGQQPIQAGQVLISEARLRGPAGAEDEFVEIYNNTNSAIVVQAVDATGGWSIVISNGQITGPLVTIPNGTIIPARGHLLCANTNGYSLSGYPSGNPISNPTAAAAPEGTFALTTPDRTWDFDVPDGSGIALFASTSGTNFTPATRLDAFGFTGSPALYKEGSGFPTVVTANLEHTYYLHIKTGTSQDTNDNAADFRLVGTTPGIQVTRLGAPGPENLNSPTLNNSIVATLLDPAVPGSAVPNRERDFVTGPNAALGNIFVRRRFTNNTGTPISRLRFRVVDITSLGTPGAECGGSCADVRALTSQDEVVTTSGGPVSVLGVTLEEPPEQPAGGALNSSLSADFITLGTPLANGQSVNIVFKLGVMTTGAFRFYVMVEAQVGAPVTVTANPRPSRLNMNIGPRKR